MQGRFVFQSLYGAGFREDEGRSGLMPIIPGLFSVCCFLYELSAKSCGAAASPSSPPDESGLVQLTTFIKT